MNKKKPSFDKTALKRLLAVMGQYKARMILVIICILLSAVATVASSLFIQTLIDDYIAPLLLDAVPDFGGLLKALSVMFGIYLVGMLCAFFYNWNMALIAQGTLKKIRDDMFAHMQKLPIPYFDQHSHGDIMSRYTNDTDTLRQMISQSLPQLLNSVISIVAVFMAMLSISVWLTGLVVICMFFILKTIGNIAGRSGKYFVEQQRALGDVNGYIEEMIHGQKVIKVFCHEDKSEE